MPSSYVTSIAHRISESWDRFITNAEQQGVLEADCVMRWKEWKATWVEADSCVELSRLRGHRPGHSQLPAQLNLQSCQWRIEGGDAWSGTQAARWLIRWDAAVNDLLDPVRCQLVDNVSASIQLIFSVMTFRPRVIHVQCATCRRTWIPPPVCRRLQAAVRFSTHCPSFCPSCRVGSEHWQWFCYESIY